LSDLDWARALFLTEVSFGSSLVGSGRRFGRAADQYWIEVLRSLADKISNYERFILLRDNATYPDRRPDSEPVTPGPTRLRDCQVSAPNPEDRPEPTAVCGDQNSHNAATVAWLQETLDQSTSLFVGINAATRYQLRMDEVLMRDSL
jgi:hypothetical protein